MAAAFDQHHIHVFQEVCHYSQMSALGSLLLDEITLRGDNGHRLGTCFLEPPAILALLIDLIAMTSVDRDDDLCHSDDFAKEGVTDETDISTLSLQRLYRFYMSGLYTRIVKFKINTIYDDLMRINYLSLRDYFLDRMQYDINATFCQSILEKKLLADMTLMDIFDYIRNSVYVNWRPYQSVDKYTQDIRYSFALFNAVFYMPFKVMLNKMYMPDECDEYDYLMRVSFLSK